MAKEAPGKNIGNTQNGSKKEKPTSSGSSKANLNEEKTEFRIGKSKAISISYSNKKDEVAGRYSIQISSPLPAFDSPMAKAYSVQDTQGKNSDPLYAIILDKTYPTRLIEINNLKGEKRDNFVNIIDFQIIESSLGEGDFLAVILERPKGSTLREYISDHGAISEESLIKKIIAPTSEVINFLAKKGIAHGKISCDNIYIDDEANITVGECISEICGYSQDLLYEWIDRASAFREGKGLVVPSYGDFYALGVLSAIMLKGINPAKDFEEDEVLEHKFTQGTYALLIENLRASPHMLDFLRGTITDQVKDIWNFEKTKEWLGGRRYNLLPPTDNIEAGRAIMFNGKKFLSRKYLAYNMFLHWDEAKKFIRDDTLIRWIDRSLKNTELAEQMSALEKRSSRQINELLDREDELLAQYLLLLDPGGPIRLKGLSVSVDGLGHVLLFGYTQNKKQYIDLVNQILFYGINSYWSPGAAYKGIDHNKLFLSNVIKKCASLLRKGQAFAGMDRCLYEMNPTLSCQSSKTRDSNIFNTERLLLKLNKSNDLSDKILDNHMVSFLHSKLELNSKIQITSLANFPEIADNIYIQNLALLSLSQEAAKIKSLTQLSLKAKDGLKNVIEEFHNKHIRNDLYKSLDKVVKNGKLAQILEVMANNRLIVKDKVGFSQASKRFYQNNLKINQLSNKKAIDSIGYRYGLQISVISSFFFATMVLLTLVIKYL